MEFGLPVLVATREEDVLASASPQDVLSLYPAYYCGNVAFISAAHFETH